MKKCPQCKSIYGDDTLSFCLQDGTPLSAAYDSEATLVLGVDDSTVQRTNANYNPEIPTETSFGGSRQTASSIRELSSNKTSPHLIYACAGLIAVLVLGGGFQWLRASGSQPGIIDNSNKALKFHRVRRLQRRSLLLKMLYEPTIMIRAGLVVEPIMSIRPMLAITQSQIRR